jgi:hypothetical protein
MANSTADTPDVSETKLAKMRIKDLREHARERGIDGADDLHKPELLARVKDWHYARAHDGRHRPDAPADVVDADKRKATDGKKSGAKKGEARKSGDRKGEDARGGKKKADGAHRALADVRRRLAQAEDALDDLEARLR